MEAAAGAGNAGRGKDIGNILHAERQEEEEALQEPVDDEAADEAERMSVDEEDVQLAAKKETKHVEFADEKVNNEEEVKTEIKDDLPHETMKEDKEEEVAEKKVDCNKDGTDDDEDEVIAPKRKKKVVLKDSEDEGVSVSLRESLTFLYLYAVEYLFTLYILSFTSVEVCTHIMNDRIPYLNRDENVSVLKSRFI
jgi:hypothetical protein